MFQDLDNMRDQINFLVKEQGKFLITNFDRLTIINRIGTSTRPPLYDSQKNPGPGQYKIAGETGNTFKVPNQV